MCSQGTHSMIFLGTKLKLTPVYSFCINSCWTSQKMHVKFTFLLWLEYFLSLFDISKVTENGLPKGITSAAAQQSAQNCQIVSSNPNSTSSTADHSPLWTLLIKYGGLRDLTGEDWVKQGKKTYCTSASSVSLVTKSLVPFFFCLLLLM